MSYLHSLINHRLLAGDEFKQQHDASLRRKAGQKRNSHIQRQTDFVRPDRLLPTAMIRYYFRRHLAFPAGQLVAPQPIDCLKLSGTAHPESVKILPVIIISIAVHGGQQLRLFNAHYDEYGFQPIVVFDGEGRFITAVLRPAKRPGARRIGSSFLAYPVNPYSH
jgi:Transposase DDE domain group 1